MPTNIFGPQFIDFLNYTSKVCLLNSETQSQPRFPQDTQIWFSYQMTYFSFKDLKNIKIIIPG